VCAVHGIDWEGEPFSLANPLTLELSSFEIQTNKTPSPFNFHKVVECLAFPQHKGSTRCPEIEKNNLPFYIGHFEILTIKRLNHPIIINKSG